MYTVPSSGHQQKAPQDSLEESRIWITSNSRLVPWQHTGQSFQDGFREGRRGQASIWQGTLCRVQPVGSSSQRGVKGLLPWYGGKVTELPFGGFMGQEGGSLCTIRAWWGETLLQAPTFAGALHTLLPQPGPIIRTCSVTYPSCITRSPNGLGNKVPLPEMMFPLAVVTNSFKYRGLKKQKRILRVLEVRCLNGRAGLYIPLEALEGNLFPHFPAARGCLRSLPCSPPSLQRLLLLSYLCL